MAPFFFSNSPLLNVHLPPTYYQGCVHPQRERSSITSSHYGGMGAPASIADDDDALRAGGGCRTKMMM